MASLLPRSLLLRPVRHALARAPNRLLAARRGIAIVGNVPPMEPQKQRPQQQQLQQEPGEMAVGELEGASFRIEPLRRVGEDEKTMRARLVYQSRKRGILESDLLLSTFADEYLPKMTRDQMVQYDLFLDENDWDIYYWATQEEPTSSTTATSTTSSPSSTQSKNTNATTEDTSSSSYGSSAETASATAESTTTTSTGGAPLTGEHRDAKDVSAADADDMVETQPFVGEWAQTVGTFKPAYRPVPARWRDSEVLKLLRQHVRARATEKGGMAFMPALR